MIESLVRMSGESPIVMMRWKNAPGWPVEFVPANVSQWGYSPDEFTSGVLIDMTERIQQEQNLQGP